MSEQWLLTSEEWEQACAAMPEGTSCGGCRKALARAQLRKVAERVQCNTALRTVEGVRLTHVTVWGAEEWEALMKEAGLK